MITNSSFDRSEREELHDDSEVVTQDVTFLQRRRRPAVYAAPAVVSLWGDRFVDALSCGEHQRVTPA